MKNRYKLFVLATVIMLAGCSRKESIPQEEAVTETEDGSEEGFVSTEEEVLGFVAAGEEGVLGFVTAEEDEEVVSIVMEYAEQTEYFELAEFLASYYQIPYEYQTETRYYYNYVDLNEDGAEEIFCVIIKDYEWGNESGPALLVQKEENGFLVLEDFGVIVTPVLISDNMTNGWHDVIYQVDGEGLETGYQICHYVTDRGYQTEENEWADEPVQVSGTRILSNNLIDDMDQGKYFTLASRATE